MKRFLHINKHQRRNLKSGVFSVLIVIFSLLTTSAFSQDFLHTKGKEIVDGNGKNFILRGIGTGNWMIQEGYMMQSSGFAGTHHEFRNKLEQTIGIEQTEEFYDSWLANHFRKVDVDSMAAWGFNCVRVAIHYKWFTPPIEEEPVQGEITWIDKGFEMIDSLLDWCKSNEMYLILDLHGTPGGQGKNADISDYDPSKPSLWESELNKEKTVALWRRLAGRYANEKWIGGYDLINEVNWTFPEGNNSQLRDLYVRITDAIREVDQNHIIFIEGNWFANDFSGLTPPWDDNMVYSFHKYWSYNNKNSLDWVINLRNQTNCPLWLGETGENSNTWFTNLVQLSEENNIGWSWWPVKKSGINNVLQVVTNDDYKTLMDTWENGGSVSPDFAYNAVMQYSENHRFENCLINYDVIDALIRQPHSTATKPFKYHSTGQKIFAVDYDLGRNKYAYYDLDTCDFHQDEDTFTAWNAGWSYRNDGVDIEQGNSAETSNGYHVGWVESSEWLQYTIDSQEEAAYKISMNTASEKESSFHIEVDGKVASEKITLPASGGWNNWENTTTENIILPRGNTKVRVVFDEANVNFNWFSFTEPKDKAEVAFKLLTAFTDKLENKIYLNLNKPVSSAEEQIAAEDIQVILNNALTNVSEIIIPEENDRQLILIMEETLFSDDKIRVSYNGNSVLSNEQNLTAFSGFKVQDKLYPHANIPGKIEAESFFVNNGFNIEDCEDEGSGKNTGYANDGDYLDYVVNVTESGNYKVNFRVAAQHGTPEILLMHPVDDRMVPIKSIKFESTGGWQTWETQSTTVELTKGKQIFRIYSRSGEHNLNWFSFDLVTSTEKSSSQKQLKVYPNPAFNKLNVDFFTSDEKLLAMFNMEGNQLLSLLTRDECIQINTRLYPPGHYILQVTGRDLNKSVKIQIAK